MREIRAGAKEFDRDYDLGQAASNPRRPLLPRELVPRNDDVERGPRVTASSGHAPEILWEDGEFVLSRGVWDGEPFPLLAAMPSSAQPSAETLARLQHAYALREELDPAWAARPLRLERHQGRLTLLMEDPGGEPLLRLLGQPWEIASFLRLAIGLAAALGQVHQRGLIHKDIKPANILVDAASGGVWLTGFGIASRLPRERQAPAPPEVIAGTLAYMAPEQTGRMNRSIDSRSDLYALGVTFYEMLTGALPFTAADPMEWVHCHIARQPVPPDERVAGIPEPLSAIVMKLLAKTAEERYQTAAGVEADLRRCLAEWESHGRIDPFPLGAHDVSDRLLIPEKLYGREREIDALLAAFDRVVAQRHAGARARLRLFRHRQVLGGERAAQGAGPAARPVRVRQVRPVQARHPVRDPGAGLPEPCPPAPRPRARRSLAGGGTPCSEALGPNGQLIVNLVPELELVIGKQPPVADLPPQDAQNRFQMVFRRFLGVFARQEHPLALFLDDLQWLDAATLDLLEHLVTHPEVRHLLLVGAYRDNEVGPVAPAYADAGGDPQGRSEGAGDRAGASRARRCRPARRRCPALRAGARAALWRSWCTRRPAAIRSSRSSSSRRWPRRGCSRSTQSRAAWHWDMDRIRAKSYTDNVVDLMAGKLKRLSATTQEALKQLACLGNVAEIATLTLVHGETEEEIHAALWEAVRAGLVLRLAGCLRVPPRPGPGGGLFADPRRRARGGTPSDWPSACVTSTVGGARGEDLRDREPARPRCHC